jgi:hypothetical protein
MNDTQNVEQAKRLGGLRRFAVAISVLNILGHTVFGFEPAWAQPVVALATAYGMELLLESVDAWAHKRRPKFLGGPRQFVDFLLPAHITALAVAMLLYADEQYWMIAFATAAAISSKLLLRAPVGRGRRHFFNPSNFGISVTLLLFPWVGIAPPYHFTEQFGTPLDWAVPVAVLFSGLLLNLQLTRKGPLIAAWVGGFVAQALVRGAFTGVATLAALSPITGAAFILFTNYMITDPGTTPARPSRQAIFGLATAAVYGLFMAEHIVFGIFFALVFVCLARGCAMWAAALRAQWLRERRPQPVDARTGALEGAPTT